MKKKLIKKLEEFEKFLIKNFKEQGHYWQVLIAQDLISQCKNCK